jgi:hypothetical protein
MLQKNFKKEQVMEFLVNLTDTITNQIAQMQKATADKTKFSEIKEYIQHWREQCSTELKEQYDNFLSDCKCQHLPLFYDDFMQKAIEEYSSDP